MKNLFTKDQQGFGHVGLLFAIVIVLAVGGVGYFVYQKNKSGDTASKALQDAIKNAKCEYDDADLCKFFASYKIQNYYTINTVSEEDGKKTTSVMKMEGEDKTHLQLGGDSPYEVITIGNTSYIKGADGTWWKRTTTETDTTNDYKTNIDTDFDEPKTAESARSTFKKLGKEKCGHLTCFKYQQIESIENTPITMYFWFDDKDYQMRRTVQESDNYKADSTYSYAKISITEPSPVKELADNQYLLPGQSEPTTLPTTDGPSEEELRQLMEQYQ